MHELDSHKQTTCMFVCWGGSNKQTSSQPCRQPRSFPSLVKLFVLVGLSEGESVLVFFRGCLPPFLIIKAVYFLCRIVCLVFLFQCFFNAALFSPGHVQNVVFLDVFVCFWWCRYT